MLNKMILPITTATTLQSILLKNFIILLLLTIFVTSQTPYNTSICLSFQLDSLYYIVNTQFTDQNVVTSYNNTDKQIEIRNYCHQVQYYCEFQNNVIVSSLVIKNPTKQDCYPYQQSQIKMLDSNNVSSGIIVVYSLIDPNGTIMGINPSVKKNIQKQYKCTIDANGIQKYCPSVDYSIIWSYFNENQLAYTIIAEVIGVIFMVLGIYIYRATVVLLGSATIFVILVAGQAYLAFTPGVQSYFLTNLLIITGVCSFVAGYVFGYFPKVGLFCMGLWLGIIITLTLNNIAFYYIKSDPLNLALYIVLPILGVAFGILTIFIKKSFIIFATSLIGAYMCLRALSWHLGAFPNQFLLAKQYQRGLVGMIQWQFYLYVISLLILTASSSALQYWLFTKKASKNHEQANLEQHFNGLQNKLEQQRQKVLQIKDLFKGKNQPRKLKKNQRDSSSKKGSNNDSDPQDDDIQFDNQNEQQEQEENENKNYKNKNNNTKNNNNNNNKNKSKNNDSDQQRNSSDHRNKKYKKQNYKKKNNKNDSNNDNSQDDNQEQEQQKNYKGKNSSNQLLKKLIVKKR